MRSPLLLTAAIAVFTLATGSGIALAGDPAVVEATGEARGAGAEGKVRAVERAFSSAVKKVVMELLPDEVTDRHGRLLTEEILRKSSRYVTSHQVLSERAIEGGVRVQVSATVDRDRLRAAIAELGIDASVRGRAERPPVVLLLKQSTPAETETSFGSAAGDGGAGGAAFRRELEGHGFSLRPATGRAPLSAEGDPDLPIGAEAAAELARQADAGGAFVVGIRIEEDGAIRGTPLQGARGRAVVRVLDTEDGLREVARAEIDGAGFGATGEEAARMAARDLGERALRAVAGAAAEHWPSAPAIEEQLVVKILGARSWDPISAVIRELAGEDGVRAVHPRDIRRGRVLLGVDTRLSAREVRSAVEEARLRSGRLKARTSGGEVWIKIYGQTRYSFEDE